MFEYSADLITSAQGDVESGLDAIHKLLGKKSSTTSLESYTGKVDVNLVFTSLAFVKKDLEELDELIISTKENIESVDVGAVGVVDSNLPTNDEIIEIINNLPISDEEKKEALRLLEECGVRAAYAYLSVISCDQEIAACDEILEILYGEIARPDFNPEKNEYDASIVETINYYEGVRDSLYEERRMWEDNLKLWKFDYLDNVELDMTDFVVDESIAPLISCLYTPDGRPRFDYAEWGVSKFKMLMEPQGKDLSDVSMFGLAMYLFTDPEYKKWYESDEGVGEPLTKEGVLEHLGISMINNSSGSLQARAFIYMDDEQVAKYNWVYANKGPEEAQKYLEALENDINLMCATDLVLADIDTLLTGNSSDSAFLRCLELNGISIADGAVMWMDNTATLFNGNTNYTVTEQKQGMLSQLVITGYACVPLTDYDLKMQLENGEITQNQYDELTSSDKQITNLDVMLVRGDISQHTYDSYNIVINDPGFQELSSKLGNNERKAMGYVSSAGLATGNMLPSVVTSGLITMAGGGAPAAAQLGRTIGSAMMWTSAYGSSYKTGIRSGLSEGRAVGFALASATAEAFGERYLGSIPFIGNGSKIALKSLPLSVIVNGGMNVLKEIGQEELQGVFVQNIIDSVFLGQPLDLSGLPEEVWDTAIVTAISTLSIGGLSLPLQEMSNFLVIDQPKSLVVSLPDGGKIEIGNQDIALLTKCGIISYDTNGETIVDSEALISYMKVKNIVGNNKNLTKDISVRTINDNNSLPVSYYKIYELIDMISNEESFDQVLTDAFNGTNNQILNAFHALAKNSGVKLNDILSFRVNFLSDTYDRNYKNVLEKLNVLNEIMDDQIKHGDSYVFNNGKLVIKVPYNFDLNNSPFTLDYVVEQINQLPSKLKNSIHTIKLWDTYFPGDTYWQFAFNNANHHGAMCAGGGEVTITTLYASTYDTIGPNSFVSVLSHEAAHNIDNNGVHSLSHKWKQAVDSDNSYVSEYASSSFAEDFAESVSYFFSDPYTLYTKCPAKAAYIEQLFPEHVEEIRNQVESVKNKANEITEKKNKTIEITEKKNKTIENIEKIRTTQKIITTEKLPIYFEIQK